MTILSRHAGIEATTTDKLLAHLTDALIPRVKPFLDRLKMEERRREQERFVRAQAVVEGQSGPISRWDSLTVLYGFADSHFIPSEFQVGDDLTSPPSSLSSRGEAAIHEEIARSSLPPEQWWKFRLATSYPRKEIPWQPNATLGGISGLESGVQLVVEIVRPDDSKKPRESLDSRSCHPTSTNASEADDDSTDEYDTESDDE